MSDHTYPLLQTVARAVEAALTTSRDDYALAPPPAPPVCGNRAPASTDTCQRSPSHTYPHRDAKQKGTETRSWWNGKDVTR
ncbi:hypothetical protein [Streptomyces sp. NBC_00062]|uniref:hypothetical protein n=1 Tax=Streptomyces sp. NBC_00062 TaxID=2975637 RepID=UPI002253DC36|nr:hypothetical protein [Streptomyces sp. NBC_00062]MCX5431899.1 hypothetical protein [Streptomyces sp. NBC_00062]